MTLIILQTQITAQEMYKTITFTFPLFNVVCSQCGLQEICCCLERHQHASSESFFYLFLMSFIMLRAHNTESTSVQNNMGV